MKNFLIFLAGAAVGAGGMYFGIKHYYEEVSREEIESVKAAFSAQLDKINADYDNFKGQKAKAEEISNTSGYKVPEIKHEEDSSSYKKGELDDYRKNHETNYAGSANPEAKNVEPDNLYPTEEDSIERPFVISPDIYDAGGSNERAILTYYRRSKCLVNEAGWELNVYDTIGEEALDHFGDFEENVVYVRNNHLGYDYEVLLDDVSEIV